LETEILNALAGAGPWALLLGWMLYRFDAYNNRLLTESAAREERIMADARDREEKLAACIDKFAENQRAMAAEISQIRGDIDEIKEEIKKNSEK